MPATIRKVKGGYRVRMLGKVTAKKTTKAKALRQVGYLNAWEAEQKAKT